MESNPQGDSKGEERVKTASWVLGLLVLSGCAVSTENADPQELMDADRAFYQATIEQGTDGWADYFAESGTMFPQTGMVQGRESIREAMAGAFEGDTELRWDPTEAHVATSGDLGYTVGKWQFVGKAADGSDSTMSTGNYVTIWSREDGGSWKVAVDIGNEDEAAPSEEEGM
jgi:ketosteroid isomerase-like protein